ncbi:MAG: hypothetical protein ACPGGK_03115 [Pikeienuella sp.]
MKVCIIGNSHVAAFTNAGASLRAKYPSFKIDFFGVSFPHNDGIACDANGVYGPDRALAEEVGLRPARVMRQVRAVNGADSVDLTQYDAVYLVGHYIKIKDIFRIIAVNDIDGFSDRAMPCQMSRAAFEDMAREIILTHVPDRLGLIADAAPTWVSIVPFLSADCLSDEGTEYAYLRRVLHGGHELTPMIDTIHSLIAERLNALNLRYIPQRSETAPQTVVTESAFSVGSRHFGEDGAAHETRDYMHMNADYAALCFDDFATLALTAIGVGKVDGEEKGAKRAGHERYLNGLGSESDG